MNLYPSFGRAPQQRKTRNAARLLGGFTLAVTLGLSVAGCGNDKFATVNGVAVTKDEYIKALERTQVALPGGQPPTTAERAVLDQLITNKVIMSEAAAANVVPSDDAVNAYYNLQKKLFEEQMPPGKDYEQSMKEQGTTTEDAKANLKVQMAETALYAKKLNISDSDIRKIYEKQNGNFGLPARVLLRLILVAPNSPDFTRAQQMLAAKTDFTTVAKTVNAPALRASGGLLPQYTPIAQITPKYQQQITQANSGAVIGPVDFQIAANQPAAKAWIRVEDKRPPYNIPFDEAALLIRQQLVQQQILQPQNAGIRNEIIQKKLDASFDPKDPSYKSVWDALKKSAKDAGIGQAPSLTGAGTGTMTAPAAAPATAPKAAAAPAAAKKP